jgi:tRNA-Thr(GGU) m(6)t(6)A37 methyltransferase TsaA
MMSESREPQAMQLWPVGRVVRGRPWPPGEERWEDQEAEIELDPAWTGALDGLDGFSHVWIIWWLDRSPPDDSPPVLHVHPEGRQELPAVGVFATRTPRRPNPIAITAVRLLGRQDNRLRVLGLDACQGTPGLDLKPYLRRGDAIEDAVIPAWLETLWRMHDEERRT